METTLANAERLGFVTRDPAGYYANVASEEIAEATGEADAQRAAEEAVKVEAEAKAQAESNKLPGEHAESATKLIADHVTPGTATKALLDMAETGSISAATLNAAAESGRGRARRACVRLRDVEGRL